ncbi:MAG: OmpA family protein [Chitinophagales bacterium]
MKPLYLIVFIIFTNWQHTIAQSVSIQIYFNSNATQPEIGMEKLIDSAVAIYSKKSNAEIALYGFCDVDADSVYNIQLSNKRITTVKEELIKRGIKNTVITTTMGYGENKPLNTNSTPEEKRFNRRVTIEIIPHDSIKTDTQIIKSTVYKYGQLKTIIREAKIGEKIVIPNLEFYASRSTIMPYSQIVLDELLAIMQENPTLQIGLIGHICCMSIAEINLSGYNDGYDIDNGTYQLSQNRAAVIRDYLVANGIDPHRVRYKGKGGSEKRIDPEITEADKQANRRVEVVIIAK